MNQSTTKAYAKQVVYSRISTEKKIQKEKIKPSSQPHQQRYPQDPCGNVHYQSR